MPRKQFFSDLEIVQANSEFEFITHLRLGDEDGQISFNFQNADLMQPVTIHALVPGM